MEQTQAASEISVAPSHSLSSPPAKRQRKPAMRVDDEDDVDETGGGNNSSSSSSSDCSDHGTEEQCAEGTELQTTSATVTFVAPAAAPATPQKSKKRCQPPKQRTLASYDLEAGLSPGQPVPYLLLARAFSAMEATAQRTLKTEHLANTLRTIVFQTPADLLPALYLIAGKVAPDYTGIELGVGESLLFKAIGDATGKSTAAIKSALRVQGDLGKVAALSKQSTRTLFPSPPLTVRGVFAGLRDIANSAGSQSRNRKQDLILRMLVACRESEATYIVRMLQGKFRIGCSEKTVLAALARAIVQTPPGQRTRTDVAAEMGSEAFGLAVSEVHTALVSALSQVPTYDEVVPLLLVPDCVSAMRSRCQIRPGMPVHPMLAQPTKGVGEVLSRLERIGFTCEYKYDGERAQIHIYSSTSEHHVAKVFSRSLEDSTGKFPDVAAACVAAASSDVESAIIDSEAVGWDPVQKKLLPFQTLSHRARKTVAVCDVKIKACVFAFDLLFLNGRSLLQEPLRQRRQLLREMFHEIEGQFAFATFRNISPGEGESAAVQPFLEEAVSQQCEGLMVKALDSQSEYLPNQRSFNWLKIKKDYMEGMTDSVDLVPIGAWYGTGKRTGWFGGFLLACYDEDGECFQAMTKVATGLSDADLEAHHAFFSEHVLPGSRPYYSVSPTTKPPDVWLDAVQVWEVKGADLTISPAYTAASGLVDKTRGVSLRFPRFLRVRTDKRPEDATHAEQVAQLYSKQTLCIAKPQRADEEDEEN